MKTTFALILLISLFYFLSSNSRKTSKFFDIYLSEISLYSVISKKTDKTVQMVCKVNSIFDEIIKSDFTVDLQTLHRRYFKK